jgi:hypothetical protein
MPIRRKNIEYRGNGFLDIIKSPVRWAKDLIYGQEHLNNMSNKTLSQYGNVPISEMYVCRTPLAEDLNSVINVLNNGKVDELREKYFGDSPLYHVALLVGLQNGKQIVLEKNASVEISPVSNQFKKNTEYLSINLTGKQLTLNKLVNDGIAVAGNDKFFGYTGISRGREHQNNCQTFVLDYLLGPQGLSDNRVYNFAYQDMIGLEQDLKQQSGSFTTNVMNKVTDMGSFVDRLIGKGKNKKKLSKEDIIAIKLYPIFKKHKFRLF